MVNVPISQLADEIVKAVAEYTKDVSISIEKEMDATAKEILKEVRRISPKRTGDYTKGFRITKRSNSGHKSRIIWNKKHPTLVHLNEFGHAKIGGGRVQGQPHLRPAYDRYASKFGDRIEQIIKRGG